MSFFRQLFGPRPRDARTSTMQTQGVPTEHGAGATSPWGERRELLRVVLRNTLNRHGIPAAWISAETLVTASRGGQKGIHWRLQIRHWDPRLLTHAVALQNSLILRVMAADPGAASWLMGISWQFALSDESPCPPMPNASFWTAEPDTAVLDTVATESENAETTADEAEDDVKADLDRLFAIRDAEFKQNAERVAGTDANQPMYRNTEPQPLEPDPTRPRH